MRFGSQESLQGTWIGMDMQNVVGFGKMLNDFNCCSCGTLWPRPWHCRLFAFHLNKLSGAPSKHVASSELLDSVADSPTKDQILCNPNCRLSCVCACLGFISFGLLFNVLINCRSEAGSRRGFAALFAWQLLATYHQSGNRRCATHLPLCLLRFWAAILQGAWDGYKNIGEQTLPNP